MILVLEGIPSSNFTLYKNKLVDSGFIYVSNNKNKYRQDKNYLLTNTLISDIAYRGEHEKIPDLVRWINNLYDSENYIYFVLLNCSYNNIINKKIKSRFFSKIKNDFKKIFRTYIFLPKLQVDIDFVTFKSGMNNIKRFVGLK